jgi:hypothetical protein
VVLRDGTRFVYAGVATYWDPAPDDRQAMRDAARRVGHLLADRVGFRGSFGIDGVMTGAGFLPTELNPRFGGGLATIARGAADRLPLVLLHHALVEDPALLRASVLEHHVTAIADERRSGGGWVMVDTPLTHTREHRLRAVDGDWGFAAPHDEVDATLHVGPGAAGGFVRLGLAPGRTPIGPSVAPRVAAALGFADRELRLGIGALAAAPSVR